MSSLRTGAVRPMLLLAILAAGFVAGAQPAPAQAAAAGDELVVVAWTGPAPPAEAVAKECRLLAHSQDLAVVRQPAGMAPPANWSAVWRPLEPLRASGDYYLYYVSDAQLARFAGDVEVLYRRGHTVLLWSPAQMPRLTAASRAQLDGLVQPVRITPHAKAWPQAAQAERVDPPRTDFHPLIAQLVAEVTIPEYVAKWQVLDDFETRYYSTIQNENSSQYMYDLFASYGLEPSFHYYSHSGTRRNVIGTLPGVVEPEKVVYITGHFDSISEDPENHAPGADDNGSGTAAFLEAARVLSQYAFHYTLKFVGFNSEEQGLIGSENYVADIAAQGEDVVACFNYDMIAYAGNDPAPPDLIIYTNSSSLPLAELLRDACLEYVPTEVEPVIVEQAIGASDHASFWDYGYLALLGIEEEAWGGDFNPWYHTSDDRIERYPQDYPTHVTQAAVAAAAQTAIPLQPDGAYLQVESVTVDDDMVGSSFGNGNGVVEYGESIELTLSLINLGQQDAGAVTGELLAADAYLTLQNTTAAFGPIPAGGAASNSIPLLFDIASDVPDGHRIDFELAITEAPDTLAFALDVAAPALGLVTVTIDDAAGGDGDGIAEPGEALALSFALQNSGSAAVTGLSGVLSGGVYVAVDATAQPFGDLAPGATASSGPFAATISSECPPLYAEPLLLELSGGNGFTAQETYVLQIGEIFRDAIETGGDAWTHAAGGAGFSDEWHLETYRNHTYDGTTSWKCGGSGAGNYGDLLHALLESDPFTLPPAATLTFWHWIEAEVSSSYPDYCYDGGLLEISVDGGAWETLTPDGGYPYLIRTGGTPGPFAAETPVYSGSHGWEEVSVDLGGYAGTARIRFAFGSDGAVAGEGWYVDDVAVTLQLSAAEGSTGRLPLALHPVGRRPADHQAAVRLDLPAAGRVELGVYDINGRLVRTLHTGALSAGVHPFVWDARESSGRAAAAGVYWIRAQVGGEARTARTVIVR